MHIEELSDVGCQWCQGEINLERPHASRRVFCCDDCQTASFAQMYKDARIEAKRAQRRICAQCAGPVPPTRRDSVSRYCSPACQRIASESVRSGRYPLTCQVCAQPFHGHHGKQIYCSNACKSRVGVAARRAKMVPVPPIACRWCEIVFTPPRGQPNRVLCSRDCSDAERAAMNAERWRQHNRRICPVCDATYWSQHPSVKAKTCSVSCGHKLRYPHLHRSSASEVV